MTPIPMNTAPKGGCLLVIPPQHHLVASDYTIVSAHWCEWRGGWLAYWGDRLLPDPVGWLPMPKLSFEEHRSAA